MALGDTGVRERAKKRREKIPTRIREHRKNQSKGKAIADASVVFVAVIELSKDVVFMGPVALIVIVFYIIMEA
jgi:hypothetical protein